jgi:aryl-alcohol dehydrogenase
MVGACGPEETVEFNEITLMSGGRTVMGILGGDSDIGPFLSELIGYHVNGQFPFDKMIGYFSFDDINEAIEASYNGSVVKPVLRIGPE